MDTGADELRAILTAYRQVKDASWPALHPGMAKKAPHWPFASEDELRAELQAYLAEASQPDCAVRVFWKLGAQFVFGGCNEHFARDAGLKGAHEVVGLDDFSPQLPWQAQAAKYRADDKQVVASGQPMLDILERQTSGSGTVQWVRVGKTPIRKGTGEVIGLLGMYELLDAKVAQKLWMERSRSGPDKG